MSNPKRVPFPAELLPRKDELQRALNQLPADERERVRLAALRSNRYLWHEVAMLMKGLQAR